MYSRNKIFFTKFYSYKVTLPDLSKGDSSFKPHPRFWALKIYNKRVDFMLGVLIVNMNAQTHKRKENTTTTKDNLCDFFFKHYFCSIDFYSHYLNLGIPLFYLFSGNSENPSPTLYEQYKI